MEFSSYLSRYQPGYLAKASRAYYMPYGIRLDIQVEMLEEEVFLDMNPNGVTLDEVDILCLLTSAVY